MDEQRKGPHLLVKRHKLQDKTPNAGSEGHDASCKSRYVSCIVSPPNSMFFLWLVIINVFSLLDTKMDRKDKLFVINEVKFEVQYANMI